MEICEGFFPPHSEWVFIFVISIVVLFYPSRCNGNFQIDQNQRQCILWWRVKSRKDQLWFCRAEPSQSPSCLILAYSCHKSFPHLWPAQLCACKEARQNQMEGYVGNMDWGTVSTHALHLFLGRMFGCLRHWEARGDGLLEHCRALLHILHSRKAKQRDICLFHDLSPLQFTKWSEKKDEKDCHCPKNFKDMRDR